MRREFHEPPARNRQEWWERNRRYLLSHAAAAVCFLIAIFWPTIIPDLLRAIGAL